MNFARVATAAVAAWVVSLPVGYVVNDILFRDIYAANAAVMRPESQMMANMPLGLVATLFGFFVFAYAYAKGYEGGKGVMEGIRFGVIVALMIDCFALIWNYILMPITATMVIAMMIDAVFEFALYGAVVGTIYKPARVAARAPAL